jgi:hypothetical protein
MHADKRFHCFAEGIEGISGGMAGLTWCLRSKVVAFRHSCRESATIDIVVVASAS